MKGNLRFNLLKSPRNDILKRKAAGRGSRGRLGKGAKIMDLREQKYVCALAECGNLTRAAEKLYISQPALSIYITNLEKSLGVTLFDRSGKRFSLTFAGERYVEKASQMLRLEEEFNREIYDIVCQNAGRLRLGISQRRGSWLIPPVAAEYEKKWPKIDLVIREGNLMVLNEMLKKSELDMVVLNQADAPCSMKTEVLFEEEFLVAVPVRHPVNEKAEYVPGERYRKLPVEALNGETLILHTPMQSSRGVEDVILKRHHVTPGKVRLIRSNETAMQMVAEGLGITFLREGYAVNMKYKKPVNYYTMDTENHKRAVVVAYKKGQELPLFMQDMVDILKKHGETFLIA